MKNKFENDFFESRDSWWSIQDQIEKHTDPNITQELRHIDICWNVPLTLDP